jgi:hypothetical protein
MSEPLSVVSWGGLEPLTPAERNVYEALERHWARHRTGIGIRELTRGVYGSVGGTHYHVTALRRKGWVSQADEGPVTIRGTLVPRVRCFYEASSSDTEFFGPSEE